MNLPVRRDAAQPPAVVVPDGARLWSAAFRGVLAAAIVTVGATVVGDAVTWVASWWLLLALAAGVAVAAGRLLR